MKRMFNLWIGMILVATLGAARQADVETIVVPLSAPGSPAILEAELLEGTIKVVGYDGAEVLVDVRFESEERQAGHHEEHEGLRRIPSISGGLTLEEDENRVSIETDWSHDEIHLEVRVPFQTSARLEGVNGDWIEVEGVAGKHELSHVNGDIRATGLRGSVVADSTNGDITIELAEVSPDAPMSFTTFNGDIDLSLPAGLSADLRLQSSQGEIYTDFDVQTKPTQARIEREEQKGGYRVRIEREVLGSIGGGGRELRIKTVNGDVYLRRLP